MYRTQICITLFFSSLLLSSCNDSGESKTIVQKDIQTKPLTQQSAEIRGATDCTYSAIDSLGKIGYWLTGQDCVIISNDPADFVELNGVRNCFQTSANNSAAGLAAFRRVKNVQKWHVARDHNTKSPSATIIQINFGDSAAAAVWFDTLSKSKSFSILKIKPKTEVWHRKSTVYFIQSYRDPNGRVLDTIARQFRKPIDGVRTGS